MRELEKTEALNWHAENQRGVVLSPSDTAFSGSRLLRYKGTDSEIVVPHFVTEIAVSAFKKNAQLTYIAIPGSVSKISSGAFMDCISLDDIRLGEGIQTINFNAFAGCCSLKSIAIPNSVTKLDKYALVGCTGLECISLNGIKDIPWFAFWRMPNLRRVVIPPCVQKIDDLAFMTMHGIHKVRVFGQKQFLKPYKVPKFKDLAASQQFIEDCKAIRQNLTIYGEPGSCAEIYAYEHGLNFEQYSEWNKDK